MLSTLKNKLILNSISITDFQKYFASDEYNNNHPDRRTRNRAGIRIDTIPDLLLCSTLFFRYSPISIPFHQW